MNEIALSIVSLLLGTVLSLWISAHYFRRSLKKSLVAFVVYQVAPLSKLSRGLLDRLHLNLGTSSVPNITELYLLLANDGDKAIREPLEPLRIHATEHAVYIEHEIVARGPAEMKAELGIGSSPSELILSCDLMNPHDYLLMRLVLSTEKEDFKIRFTIVCDELPRSFGLTRLTHSRLKGGNRSPMTRHPVMYSTAATVAGASTLLFLLFSSRPFFQLPGYLAGPLSEVIAFIATITIFTISIVLFGIGAIVLVAFFADGKVFGRKVQYHIPDEVLQKFLYINKDF